MMPGIVKSPNDTPYKIQDIPVVAERSRYAKTDSPTEAVQLRCDSCHVLDSTEIKRSANPSVATVSLPARSQGAYYLPATFENTCRACHILTVPSGDKPLEVPHGVQPGEVKEFLSGAYSSQILADEPKILDSFVPSVKIPGKTPVDATVGKKRDESLNLTLRELFPKEVKPPYSSSDPRKSVSNANNCTECHYYGPLDDRGIPKLVEPTNVPEIWFTNANFDHSAHRGVSCRECHAKAEESWVATDYLNPGIDNCVQCHAPASSGAGWLGLGSSKGPTGGVSYDCTECHRYHNGDKALQGYGASAENPTTVRSISKFLSGTGGEPPKIESTPPPKK
jgi:hypothetical protein